MNENSKQQLFYTAEETALMFAAACDEIATQCASREDLSPEERVRLAVRSVLFLIDDGNAEVGVPMAAMMPRLDDMLDINIEGAVDFRITDEEEDFAGSLHEFFDDKDSLAAGNKLREEFGTNLGAHLVKFGLSTEDTFYAENKET